MSRHPAHPRTLHSWWDIYNLPSGAEFTDSRGNEYRSRQGDAPAQLTGKPQTWPELPVTLEPTKVRIRKLQGLSRWAVTGRAIYESFGTWDAAMAYALSVVRR